MITVNGKELSISAPLALSEYLASKQYEISKIAVELNGTIVPKSSYNATILHDGDHLEVVSFVGGG